MSYIPAPLQQEVLYENAQIFRCITTALENARREVLVVSAWFTNPDLFQCLLDAADRGVRVRVIIADYEENRKLDFSALVKKGATVYTVGQTGYRGMRQRFCVVDQQTAVHGSYYWTISAHLNNQESVIVTNHPETVNSLIRQFTELQQMIVNGGNEADERSKSSLYNQAEATHNTLVASPKSAGALQFPVAATPDIQSTYSYVLDCMIAAEVSNFDRELLRKYGYERAKTNNGDAQVLSNAMDSVYSLFIYDLDVVEDKKKRLIGKINEQQIVHSGILEKEYQAQLRTIEARATGALEETSLRLADLKVKAEGHKLDIATIRDHKLPAAESVIKEKEAGINALEQDAVAPRFKWYEFIPVTIFSLGLLYYLVLFYSSAVYILIFSEAKAKADQLNGSDFIVPQVFEPKAFSYILQEGGYAIGFVCMFIFIPLTLSVIGRLAKGSFISRGWVTFVFTLVLDAGIAYKVAAAIHELDYITGRTNITWDPLMVFKDSNFYLVFLLGSLGLLIFNALFTKLLNLLEERNPDIQALKRRLAKQQALQLLDQDRASLIMLQESADQLSKDLLQVNNAISLLEMALSGLPHQKVMDMEKCTVEVEQAKKVLADVTLVYTVHIENDILPVSLDSLKDRISVFLEGWTAFLNSEYAEARAMEKSRQAIEAAFNWQQQKLTGNRIDNRIKAL